jgi:acyl carrier protein
MITSERMFFLGFGLVATFIITMMLRDWLRKRRIIRALARQIPRNDAEFAREFFPDPNRADIAVRVRRVLADNLEMSLLGLTPQTRLDDDLHAELAANPDLFWELEAEFQIKTDVDERDDFEKVLARLATFQDLVAYVESKIAGAPPPGPAAPADEPPSRLYELAIRTIPVLCITGWVTLVLGILIQASLATKLGTVLFLAGIAVWGLANGGELLRTVLASLRNATWKERAARPGWLIFMSGLGLFFLWIGGTLLWAILKKVLRAE